MSNQKGAATALFAQQNVAGETVCEAHMDGENLVLTVPLDKAIVGLSKSRQSVMLANVNFLTESERHGQVRVGMNISHKIKAGEIGKYRDDLEALAAQLNQEAPVDEAAKEAEGFMEQIATARSGS